MRSAAINRDKTKEINFITITGSDMVTIHSDSQMSFCGLLFHMATQKRVDLQVMIDMPPNNDGVKISLNNIDKIMSFGGERDFMCSLYEFPQGTSDADINGVVTA